MKRKRANGGVLLEVCIESVDDAVAAASGGADRIELNAALALDGLTPSPGLVAETLRVARVPVVAMARPRAGDFDYSAAEFRVVQRDVAGLLEQGVAGIALGILTPRRQVDIRRCRAIVRQISDAGREAVFHRAFDLVANPDRALVQLIDLGVRRVMTSGGRPTATEGAGVIRRLIEAAGGRIEILPAGGIRPANAARLVEQTGCEQLHTSLRNRRGRMNRDDLAKMSRAVQG